jgi:Ca-activated chloride channel family protein
LEDNRQSRLFTGGVQPGTATRRAGGAATGSLSTPKPIPSANMPASVNATTGADAVQLSKMAREQQDVFRVKEEGKSDAVRRVSGKTFYLVDGVWTDSEFKAESRLPETALVFGSEEYFALLKQNPKLGSYFALGERVVVVFEGRVYRVK